MLTFNNFLENQTISGKIVEVATLMAENETNANVFLKTWFDENEPELSIYLAEAGVWDGIKQAGSAVWNGVKQGAQNYQRSVSGPSAYYQSAVDSLNKLVNTIQKDPQLSKNYSRLNNNINGILDDLRSNQGEIPINNNGQWVTPNQQSYQNAGGNNTQNQNNQGSNPSVPNAQPINNAQQNNQGSSDTEKPINAHAAAANYRRWQNQPQQVTQQSQPQQNQPQYYPLNRNKWRNQQP